MLVVIVLLILILLFIILNKKTEVFKNFRRIDPYIYNKLETMGDDERIIDLDKILPKNIKIVNIRRKGKGIILLKNVRKGNVIYFVPIKYYNDDFSPIIICNSKQKVQMDRYINSFQNSVNNKFIFGYWDSFLNDSSNENAYYDKKIYFRNNKAYAILRAKRNINSGEELLINYSKVNL